MRIGLSWRRRRPRDGTFVVEVVTPRTNTATLTSAENFFASMAVGEPFSVELAADSSCRRFLVRSATAGARDQLLAQIGAAYPQADFRVLDAEEDPALARNGEQVAACTLRLRSAAYPPLRIFEDREIDALSERLGRFLRFTIDRALRGEVDKVK